MFTVSVMGVKDGGGREDVNKDRVLSGWLAGIDLAPLFSSSSRRDDGDGKLSRQRRVWRRQQLWDGSRYGVCQKKLSQSSFLARHGTMTLMHVKAVADLVGRWESWGTIGEGGASTGT